VNDKQILITGATNGIGLAAAEALAALGANLAIVGRSETKTRIALAHAPWQLHSVREGPTRGPASMAAALREGRTDPWPGKMPEFIIWGFGGGSARGAPR
jgi:NAD(P)-dependent dehydrogenase (short-subunit alcohol dehydrogenase family)